MDKKSRYYINYTIIFFFGFLCTNSLFSQQDGLSTIKTVVIDAGHGGKDPGCHGRSALEKHVCLSMALKLGEAIKTKYPSVNVIFTRDTDVFVELDDRAKIANKSKADLFICIHANSASEAAFGTETYVLGLHKTEAQKQIAERENSTIYLEEDKGAKYKDFDMSPDAIIARQLQLSVFLDQSINFASKLQSEFKKIGRSDRGVRQAGFLVLYKTTMPSVLIETGFLTNYEEEKFLNDTVSQRKMANSMFTAFEKYKNEIEGVSSKTNSTKAETNNNGESNASNGINSQKNNAIIFKVQIETSDSKLRLTDSKFMGLDVSEYQQNNLFKYTVGSFENDFESANNHKNLMREKGFQHAFVVAFMNGERVNLEKAIKLAEK